MDLYEERTFDEWLEESTRKELLEDLHQRWEGETDGNVVFISAIERRNLDALRKAILEKVRVMYRMRYPYRSEFLY